MHRAGCGTIGGTPALGSHWTKDYVKVCGDRDELEAFARGVSAAPRHCGLCLRGVDANRRRSARSAGRAGALSAERSADLALDPAAGPSANALPAAGAAATLADPAVMFAIRAGPALQLAVVPRLASWNAAGDPAQVRLEAFLTATEDLLRPRWERLAGPLALRLDVGLPPAIPLLDHHDLDNYLFPLATRLSTTAAGRLVSTLVSPGIRTCPEQALPGGQLANDRHPGYVGASVERPKVIGEVSRDRGGQWQVPGAPFG